ncbi:MAG: TatD family hydrolase [Deltaproteobacteria bacterium]|nr:TatD family hydrolase [Deltaproteobacteria bacterium]
MRAIDTHVHLDDPAFIEGAAAVWQEARRAGVEGAIAVGVEPATWSRTLAVARGLPGVRVALGIHPQAVPALDDETIGRALADLPALLGDHGAVAIGECGLDGPAGDLDRQGRVLREQLALARDLALPVSLHVFRVHGPALKLLRDLGPLPAGGVVHSYSGSAELVRDYLRLGWSFSFAGAVTRSNAKRPLAAALAVPLDHLLVETDAPFQPTGADARDRTRGEPRDLPEVIGALARARGLDPEELAETTTANARRIFRL